MSGTVTDTTADGLGPWVRHWRHANRWTQERLAEQLGYDVSYVAKIERGSRRPTPQFLTRLATVADVPADDLLRMSRRPSARLRLPVPVQPLVGRAAEVAELCQLLRGDDRCLTLLGAPGIGKTSLALEVAWQVADDFRHGACFVPLADVSQAEAVPAAIVHCLGLREQGRDPAELVATTLRRQSLLLVLDNFEHVLGAAGIVERLTEAAPHVRVLATSRERLRIGAERHYEVPALRFPDPATDALDDAESYPAVRVFVDRSRVARPSFALDDHNRRPVVEICAHLDGLPLALNLTATASRLFSPSDIARSLRDRLEVPADPVADPLAHGRLGSALDWSWELLGPTQKALLARLGVFAGGFTVAAAEAVCGWDGDDVLHGLAELESKSLLEVVHTDDGGCRFTCLETVRRYALQRLAEEGGFEEQRRRHCEYFVALAEEAEAKVTGHPDQGEWLRRLDTEYANLASAFEWAAARQAQMALALAGSLSRYFALHRIADGRRMLERALDRARSGSVARVRALNGFAALARLQGDLDRAQAALDEARQLAAQLGEAGTMELAASALIEAALADDRGDYDESEQLLEEAVKLSASAGYSRGEGHAVCSLGVIALRRGDTQIASARFLESMRLFRALRDWWSVAVAVTNLGWIAERAGELTEAKDCYEEARQLCSLVGDEHGLARSVADLGRVSSRQRDFKRARSRLEEALHAFHRLGDRRLAAACLLELALVALERNRRDIAARLLGAAASLRESLGTPAWPEEQELEARIEAELRQAMGEPAWLRALAVGRSLSLEDAVDMVESDSWPPAYRGRRMAR